MKTQILAQDLQAGDVINIGSPNNFTVLYVDIVTNNGCNMAKTVEVVSQTVSGGTKHLSFWLDSLVDVIS
jgi:hypothetical protein